MFGFGKKNDLFDTLYRGEPAPAPAAPSNVVDVTALGPYQAPVGYSYHDGDKFPGGFGSTDFLLTDYWTLRVRSAQMFKTNLYGRGLIRRMVTNEVNTGLHVETLPEESILGVPEDSLADWSEMVENRFHLWCKSPLLCDTLGSKTFGALQQEIRRESLGEGDVLVVLSQNSRTLLPSIRLISGSKVQTPIGAMLNSKNRIEHGVELDEAGRHIAFWVQQDDGTSKRLAATGKKSGRRLAWLVYGTDKRRDEVRGEPLLSLVLQSLREIDRYRDSTQRKAVINSMLAMFIKKGEDKQGTKAITGGAVRKGVEIIADSQGDRSHNVAEHIPGLVLEELQHGEEPQAFMPNGAGDQSFGDFEESIIQAIAWANEVPPEILRLSFSSNYSASQAAINEYKIYLNMMRKGFAEVVCQPVYEEWLLAETLNKKIVAPGLVAARRDPNQYDTYGAWVMTDWGGHIKPAVDLTKLVKGYTQMVDEGFMTRDRAARELTGTKYSKNIKKLERENLQRVDAMKPMIEAERPPVVESPEGSPKNVADKTGSPSRAAEAVERGYLRAAD